MVKSRPGAERAPQDDPPASMPGSPRRHRYGGQRLFLNDAPLTARGRPKAHRDGWIGWIGWSLRAFTDCAHTVADFRYIVKRKLWAPIGSPRETASVMPFRCLVTELDQGLARIQCPPEPLDLAVARPSSPSSVAGPGLTAPAALGPVSIRMYRLYASCS